MDYSKIKIPFLKPETIKKRAENFRKRHRNGQLPIDIEKIIDVYLGINIIPIPGLERICNADALITSDWQSLYIDKDLFDDERRQNRLRFSLAHEIGHYVLHQNFYACLAINSFQDFYDFIEIIPIEQYGYLETQANKFASYLLVPRQLLSQKFKEELGRVKKTIDISRFDKTLLKSYIANPLAKTFGISEEAMEIILSELDFC